MSRQRIIPSGKIASILFILRAGLFWRLRSLPPVRRFFRMFGPEGIGERGPGELELGEISRRFPARLRIAAARRQELADGGSLKIVRIVARAWQARIASVGEGDRDYRKIMDEHAALLSAIKQHLPEIKKLAEYLHGPTATDRLYRYFHHSLKVYALQEMTEKAVELLQSVAPSLPLAPLLTIPVARGTGMKFDMSHNASWTWRALWITQAFLLVREVVDQVVASGETLSEAPSSLPSEWALVLEVYGIR